MNRIPVFFDPRLVSDVPVESPSAGKPRDVVREWLARYPIELHGYAPATIVDLCRAHSPAFVQDILTMQVPNGMETDDVRFLDSLYWTTGSLLNAARHALSRGIAVSPTSGFHHAGYDYCWGFCTFNGLMIAAQSLLTKSNVQKIGILDFDQHRGDGTEDIVRRLNLDAQITHITGLANYPREKQAFLATLPQLLEALSACDLIIYQAGADQHENDPLGGFLSSAEMRYRDARVFDFAKIQGIPLVWNLAGGYQTAESDGTISIQPVLDLHNATMEECVRIFQDNQ
ncbi:hypothetical protein OPU71_16895 [Niveibacterium sp. 24ML]|uniref:hypothetical protein n=1 Tax=Niveibacterium sp. 24ML TaxID=2985512 RepID=UPI00226FEF64|nr:hypothetical protein [Niveibacterium sp. 24ML]MCX9157803.1 hypothetical protein [Niveibacterium sp. 24ML]